jgi:threonine dehydrogenase-like Zn-dependent dehydrogenase
MSFPLFDLTGRRALVTGSSQGIGLALAEGLAAHGAEVVLNGREGAKLEAAAGRLAGVASASAAFAEPFAVTLHAVARAGSLLDRRMLVTGCGPIGALAIIAARAHGAREIVATDVADGVLDFAGRAGADRTINVARAPEALAGYGAGKDSFDVPFEASANAAAIRSGLDVLRPRGVLVQLGLGATAQARRTSSWRRRSRSAALSASTERSRWPSTSSTSVASTSPRY